MSSKVEATGFERTTSTSRFRTTGPNYNLSKETRDIEPMVI